MSSTPSTSESPSRKGLWSWTMSDWATQSYATIIDTFVFATGLLIFCGLPKTSEIP